MNTLILTPGMDGRDGVSAVSRQVAAALSEAENDLTDIWSLADGPGEVWRQLTRIRGAGGNKARFIGWAWQASIRPRPELVVVLHAHLAPAALPLMSRGVRSAVFLHGIEAWRPLPFLRRLALRRTDILIANSRYTALRFKEANPAHAGQEVRLCHLGAPVMMPDGPSPFAGERFALIVGRMAAEERYKGHDLLLDIWPTVRHTVGDAHLVVVGEGDDRVRLEHRARTLGLEGQVRFLGRVSDDVLARLYGDCLFFVMPSRGEGFGLVFLEAMQAGKPCLAGTGAAGEVIEHDVTGLIVNPSDRAAVLAAVLRLFQEPETRRRLGKAAQARFIEHFSAERFHQRVREALGRDGSRRVCVV